MRISNISQYLGGANNVIARDIIEQDSFRYSFTVGTQDLSNYEVKITTELYKANVATRGSKVTFESFEKYQGTDTEGNTTLVNNGVYEYPSMKGAEGNPYLIDPTDNSKGLITIPGTLLSNLTTDHASIDASNPFVVVMSITLDNGTLNFQQTFRMLWIVRYRPFAPENN